MDFSFSCKKLARIALLVGAVVGNVVYAAPVDDEVQILLKPKQTVSEVDLKAVLDAHGGRRHKDIGQLKVRVIRTQRGNSEKLLKALKQRKDVEYAEVDQVAQAFGTANDPYFTSGQEWHLAKIQATSAWDVTTGSSNVIVAVVDTGVAAGHPDLAGKILPGYDFVSNDSDPSDDNGHGTAVAGTLAAASNNSVGVSGVTWANPILPVKVLDSTGSGSHSAISSGIVYAADHGARIINLSLGGTSNSQTLQDAANYAWNKGAVVIAAAGNNGNNVPCYPAACQNVVAVAATNSADGRPSWSNYGSYVDVAAPGENIVTTSAPNGYGSWNGTSFACPVASGVAALMASANQQLSNAQLVNLFFTSCDDIGAAGVDENSGNGRVNVSRAVLAARGFIAPDTTLPVVSFASPANAATVSGTVNVAVNATDNTSVSRIEIYVDGQLEGQTSSASATFAWDTLTETDGQHTLEARAYDPSGNVGKGTVSVTVRNGSADRVAPTATILSPANGSRLLSTTRISIASSDNVAVTKVALYIDGRLAGSTTIANPTFTWSTSGVALGWHTIQAYAYDAAGNVGSSAVIRVWK
ncbi:S8 family serine peptidase [Verrucomicrobiota bacterium sgz303538]